MRGDRRDVVLRRLGHEASLVQAHDRLAEAGGHPADHDRVRSDDHGHGKPVLGGVGHAGDRQRDGVEDEHRGGLDDQTPPRGQCASGEQGPSEAEHHDVLDLAEHRHRCRDHHEPADRPGVDHPGREPALLRGRDRSDHPGDEEGHESEGPDANPRLRAAGRDQREDRQEHGGRHGEVPADAGDRHAVGVGSRDKDGLVELTQRWHGHGVVLLVVVPVGRSFDRQQEGEGAASVIGRASHKPAVVGLAEAPAQGQTDATARGGSGALLVQLEDELTVGRVDARAGSDTTVVAHPSCSDTKNTSTTSPLGEYLMALPTTFQRIWRTRNGSARRCSCLVELRTRRETPASWARSHKRRSTVRATSQRSTSARRSATLPAQPHRASRRSSTEQRSRPEPTMSATSSPCTSSSGPPTSSPSRSENPAIALSGVRSSWDILDRNTVRSWRPGPPAPRWSDRSRPELGARRWRTRRLARRPTHEGGGQHGGDDHREPVREQRRVDGGPEHDHGAVAREERSQVQQRSGHRPDQAHGRADADVDRREHQPHGHAALDAPPAARATSVPTVIRSMIGSGTEPRRSPKDAATAIATRPRPPRSSTSNRPSSRTASASPLPRIRLARADLTDHHPLGQRPVDHERLVDRLPRSRPRDHRRPSTRGPGAAHRVGSR